MDAASWELRSGRGSSGHGFVSLAQGFFDDGGEIAAVLLGEGLHRHGANVARNLERFEDELVSERGLQLSGLAAQRLASRFN